MDRVRVEMRLLVEPPNVKLENVVRVVAQVVQHNGTLHAIALVWDARHVVCPKLLQTLHVTVPVPLL